MATLWSYSPTEVTKILHAIPHLTFKFKLLQDPKFTLDEPAYLQSLAVVGLMPVVLLLLSMIGFFIFYCCVGVKHATRNKTNSSSCYCSVCLMVICVMLALCGVGVGIYGSMQVSDGISAASKATLEINQSFSTITRDVSRIFQQMDFLEQESDNLLATQTNTSEVQVILQSVSDLRNMVDELPSQTEGANDRLEWMINLLKLAEWYRMVITYVLIGCNGLVCLLALLGIFTRSKCVLMLTTFLGLLCIFTSYIYVGTLLMLDVGFADLCMEPYVYVRTQAVDKLYMNNATANYYLACPHQPDSIDPYSAVMVQAEKSAGDVEGAILAFDDDSQSSAVQSILDHMYSATRSILHSLNSLSPNLHCQSVHNALEDFVPATCVSSLEGLFIVSASILGICFTLTTLLCAAPKTWRRFSRKTTRDDPDLDDVFLPSSTSRPARPVVSRTNNPLYIGPDERFSRRVSSNVSPPAATNTLSFFRRSEEDLNLLDQPPPEYSPPSPSPNRNAGA